ncbi:tubulin-like doman-containing protein [Haloplanus salilacus]|uniref:tubulin-like doman-containing protein n=1 Tax=Haloplanus salilacus TaxID=2949994 RepID=UPI0030CF31FB
MARYRVPDHLVCLGGGGIEVGKTFMRQRWILEEVLRDDPRDEAPDEDARPLHAYFVDSDESTLSTDIEDEIQETVESIKAEYGIRRHPDVDGTVINVVDGPHKKCLRPERMTARTDISKLALDQNLQAWWLQQGGDSDVLAPLSGLERGGVDRIRGLTKAIYRISQWQGDPLGAIERSVRNDAHDEPHVAIVVGLGGGTGSGLLLDLAHRIKQAGATVTLFGILPKPSGRDTTTVLANAYATLSELEYLALSGLNLFDARILLPYDPAVDDDTFDKAAVYTITAFYNLSGAQVDAYRQFDETDDAVGPPEYAPFTLASTRYLHYPGGQLDRIRNEFHAYVEDKSAALDVEAGLYDDLRAYLTERHPDAARELHTTVGHGEYRLPSADALDLKRRLDDIRELLERPLLKQLEFRSAPKLLEVFDEVHAIAENQATWDDDRSKDAAVARDFVPRLADGVGDVDDYEPEGGWEPGEEEFVRAVLREIELLARRAGIIEATEALRGEADEVATEIRNAISEENNGYATEIRDEIGALEGERVTVEDEIERLEAEIEEGTHRVEEYKDEWDRLVVDVVDEYHALAERRPEIDRLLDELRLAIEEAVDFDGIRHPDEIELTGTGFDQYRRLNELLDDVGHDPIDEAMIEETIQDVKRAKQLRLEAARRQGTLRERILSLFGMGAIAGLREDYRMLETRIDGHPAVEGGSELVHIPSWTDLFEAEIRRNYFEERSAALDDHAADVLDELEVETKRVVDDAMEATTVSVSTAPDVAIREHLDPEGGDATQDADSARKLLAELRGGPVEEYLSAVLVAPFEERLRERKDERDDLLAELEAYEGLESIVTGVGREYTKAVEGVERVDGIETRDPGYEEGFRIETMPYSRGKLLGTDDLGDADLWTDKERTEIVSTLTDILPQVGDEYLPIDHADISDPGTERVKYDGHRIGSAFMSPLFEGYVDGQEAAIPEVKEEIVDNRRFTEDGYHNVGRGAFADSYDFAMATFLRGVFLDNLSIFTTECRDAYTSTTDVEGGDDRHNPQDEVPDVVKRHSYGLDGVTYLDDDFLPDESDGGFCYRRDVLNLDRNGTEVLLDRTDEEVAETLLEDYHEVVGYPSTVEMD